MSDSIYYQPDNPAVEQREDVMKDVEFEEGKQLGDWRIEKKIDEGEYGKVYWVKNQRNGIIGALKAESNALEGGSALKLEGMMLRKLNELGPAPHIPELLAAAKHTKYSYIVMTLLGPDLKQLLKKCNRKFTPGTWSRVGMQCLYAIKYVHDHGFVHRHIKPRNFLLGDPVEVEKARIVHIIDFGLARQFAYYKRRDSCWKAREPRTNALFRGDVRYASPNVHIGREQGRLDDVYSLLYMIIEMNGGGLPWQSEDDIEKVKALKLEFSCNDLMFSLPTWTIMLFHVLKDCDYYKRPDYVSFHIILHMVMKDKFLNNKENVNNATKYDWEDEEPKHENRSAPWLRQRFFRHDPIRIGRQDTLERNDRNRKKANTLHSRTRD